MLRVFASNRLETLAEVFLARFADASQVGGDPLRPIDVVVPSMGTGQWLRHGMAEALGIAAQFSVQLPASFAWQVFRAFDPSLPGESEYALERLRWRLFHLLPTLDGALYAPLLRYLEDDDADRAQRKRYQLATRLAVLFDQYLVYRRDWIAAFEGAKFRTDEEARLFDAEPWQPALWQRLVADIGGARHRARVFDDVLAGVLDPDVPLPPAIPAWVTVFGVPALPPDLVLLFGALGKRIDVDVLVPNACKEYWADIVSPRALALRDIRLARSAASTVGGASAGGTSGIDPLRESHYFETGHPLLASCGRMNREGVDLLNELVEALGEDAAGSDCFEAPEGQTMLARLQSDILHLRNPDDVDDAEARRVAADDTSIEVHVCHSPLREVEVLHDRLLAGFAADPALEPRHVVVMVPDLETYAPLIEAVFDSVPAARRIRVAIADRLDQAAAPVIAALRQLLRLDSSRWTASEVLALLDIPAVQARFDLADDRLQQARHWLREAGVRWGRDASDWRRRGLPVVAGAEADDDAPAATREQPNTWAFGIERLLLGYAMPDAAGRYEGAARHEDDAVEFDGLFDGIAPVAGVEGQAARALDGVLRLLDELTRVEQELRTPVDATGWQQRIERWVGALFAPARDDADAFLALRGLRDALRRLVADQPAPARDPAVATTDDAAPPVLSAAVVREFLEDAWVVTPETPRYLTGAVTVCTLLPMRTIPFAHVHLLGMNERDFPRQATPPTFDLMAHGGRRKGDRVRRDEDRQLFLDAVLSARVRLHLSYVGESDRSGLPRNPSVLVTELLEVLQQRFERDDPKALLAQLVRRHPLQPFSPDYDGVARITYEDLWTQPAAARVAVATDHAPAGDRVDGQGADDLVIVSPAALRQFLRRPAAWHLRNVLDARVPEEIDTVDDDEPMALDALERHGLASAALDAMREDRFDAWAARALASGALPHGLAGTHTVEGWRNQLGALLANPGARAPVSARRIDLELPGVRVQGELERCGPEGYLHLRVGKVSGRDLADAYVAQLLLCASGLPANSVVYDVEKAHRFVAVEQGAARDALAGLVALYRLASAQPLPLFVRTSQARALAGDDTKALSEWGTDAERRRPGERGAPAERHDDDVFLLWGDRAEPPEGWQDCAEQAYRLFAQVQVPGRSRKKGAAQAADADADDGAAS